MMTFEQRVNLLKNLHKSVQEIDDKTAYYDFWINLVPDEPDQEDFEDIATDKTMYKEVLELYCQLILKYCF